MWLILEIYGVSCDCSGTNGVTLNDVGKTDWYQSLTHLPQEKMAAILADDIFKCISFNENDKFRFKFHWNLLSGVPIDNKPALVHIMAWRRTGDKPLPEPMMTQFTDAYMWH